MHIFSVSPLLLHFFLESYKSSTAQANKLVMVVRSGVGPTFYKQVATTKQS